MADKVILLTGYPPFGKYTLNPSSLIAEALNGREIAGFRVVGITLPCDYKLMPPSLADSIERLHPAIIIGNGLAFGESQMRVERVGLNWLDFGFTPDNGGHLVKGEAAIEDGSAAYFSTIPVQKIVGRLRQEGIPAYLSGHAGGHLCNHMLYIASHLVARLNSNQPLVGFIHLPALPNQAVAEALRDNSPLCVPSMNLELMLHGLEIVMHESVLSLEQS
jgi:pyroglutamyl-peptidase